MIITDEWLINNKTLASGYNKNQFNILGMELNGLIIKDGKI